MVFSAGEFPGASLSLTWVKSGMRGNYYYCHELAADGWLCPALFKFFDDPPATLYVKVAPLSS